MWTKVMIFLIVFFIVANPSTFKIMRGVLGSWVASADGLATPAGLILHSLVFVGLAIMVPKYLMRSSYYEDEDYEDEDYEDEDYEDEDYEDEDTYEEEEFKRLSRTEHKRRALLREAALKASGATSSYEEPEEYRRMSRTYWAKRNARAKAALRSNEVKDPIA